MREENLEYQYLQTQLQSNRYVKSILQHNITQLLNIVSQYGQTIKEIEQHDNELNARVSAIGKDNGMVLVDFFPLPQENRNEVDSI